MAAWTASSLTPGLQDSRQFVQANMLNPNANVTGQAPGQSAPAGSMGNIQSLLLSLIMGQALGGGMGGGVAPRPQSTDAENIAAAGYASGQIGRSNAMLEPANILNALTGGTIYTNGVADPSGGGFTEVQRLMSQLPSGYLSSPNRYAQSSVSTPFNDENIAKYELLTRSILNSYRNPSAISMAAQGAGQGNAGGLTFGGRQLQSNRVPANPTIANTWGQSNGLPPVFG